MAPLFTITADQKKALARALVELGDANAFKAALHVFGSDSKSLGLALYAANELVNDPEVIEEKTRLLGPASVGEFLPTKEQVMRKLWEMSESFSFEGKERINALKLYSELSGFIVDPKKGGTASTPPAIIYEVDPTSGDEPDADEETAGAKNGE